MHCKDKNKFDTTLHKKKSEHTLLESKSIRGKMSERTLL